MRVKTVKSKQASRTLKGFERAVAVEDLIKDLLGTMATDRTIRYQAHEFNQARCKPPLPTMQVEELIEAHTKARDSYRDEGSLLVTRASDVQMEAIDYLWPSGSSDHGGYLARGVLHIVAGMGGVGKSLIAEAELPAIMSRGAAWPDGAPGAGVRRSLIIGDEDGWSDTVNPRLKAAGADRKQIWFVKDTIDANGKSDQFNVERDASKLLDVIQKLEVDYVVISPLTAYMGAANLNKDSEVRKALTPLRAVARETGVALVAISHLNKSTDVSASNKVLGSVGFVNVARTVYMVANGRDPDKVGIG